MGTCTCVQKPRDCEWGAETLGRADYAGVIKKIQPGDIVLYRSNHARAVAQRVFCGTEFDHVGILVKDFHCGEDGVPCCGPETKRWQAEQRRKDPNSPLGQPWHTLEAMGDGVDVYPFTAEQVQHFNGVQAVRRVKMPDKMRRKAEPLLHAFMNKVKGMPYSPNALSVMRAANFFGENQEEGDLQSFFCSELVAAAWKAMDVLPKKRHSNMYIPGDFSTSGDPDRAAVLNHGYKLGGEVVIVPDNIEESGQGVDKGFYKSHPKLPLGYSLAPTPAMEHGAELPADVTQTPATIGPPSAVPAPVETPCESVTTPSRPPSWAMETPPSSQVLHSARSDDGCGVWSRGRVHVPVNPNVGQELLEEGLGFGTLNEDELRENLRKHHQSIQQSARRTLKPSQQLIDSIADVESRRFQQSRLWQTPVGRGASSSKALCPPFELPGSVNDITDHQDTDQPTSSPEAISAPKEAAGHCAVSAFGTVVTLPSGDGPLKFDDLSEQPMVGSFSPESP